MLICTATNQIPVPMNNLESLFLIWHLQLACTTKKEIKKGNKTSIKTLDYKRNHQFEETKAKLYNASLHGTEQDKKQYKRLRYSLTHKNEQAKCEYYSKIISETNTTQNFNITHLINEVGNKITESTKINNMFNTYFTNIGQDLAVNIEKYWFFMHNDLYLFNTSVI